jgi:hypothetical protein
MKTLRSGRGPFLQRPYFKPAEIEEMCATALRDAELYPASPAPVRIERFIEKRFRVTPRYETLSEGVLGFTKFGPSGVEAIVIATKLDDATAGKSNERRLRTTMAHEAGHGLMHAHLFCLGTKPKTLFGDDDETPEIMCRDVAGEGSAPRGYDGRWWEFQANKAIGALLMPRRLVEQAVQGFIVEAGNLGHRVIRPADRERAIRGLSDTFDVNPIVARIRLDDVFPPKNDAQLLL